MEFSLFSFLIVFTLEATHTSPLLYNISIYIQILLYTNMNF